MKRWIVAAGLVAGAALMANAQETPAASRVASAGVFGLSANVGGQVEQRVGRHFSLGLQAARYFSTDYPGFQAALLGRYYFLPTAPAGLFVQAQAGGFRHDAQEVNIYPAFAYQSTTTTLQGYGGGLALGYQWLVGSHLAVNAALGVRVYPRHWSTYLCDCDYVGDWHSLGQPGSVLDSQVSVGYAF